MEIKTKEITTTELIECLVTMTQNPQLLDTIPPFVIGSFLKSIGYYLKKKLD